jgi:hypothetical protein
LHSAAGTMFGCRPRSDRGRSPSVCRRSPLRCS